MLGMQAQPDRWELCHFLQYLCGGLAGLVSGICAEALWSRCRLKRHHGTQLIKTRTAPVVAPNCSRSGGRGQNCQWTEVVPLALQLLSVIFENFFTFVHPSGAVCLCSFACFAQATKAFVVELTLSTMCWGWTSLVKREAPTYACSFAVHLTSARAVSCT